MSFDLVLFITLPHISDFMSRLSLFSTFGQILSAGIPFSLFFLLIRLDQPIHNLVLVLISIIRKSLTKCLVLVPILLLMQSGTIEDFLTDLTTMDCAFQTDFATELLGHHHRETLILGVLFNGTDVREVVNGDHESAKYELYAEGGGYKSQTVDIIFVKLDCIEEYELVHQSVPF